jgi:cyanophycinase
MMIRLIFAVLAACQCVLGQGYICAEGGGNAGKGAWADEVFGWMVEKGGHGKVVLLGAVKLDEDSRPALFTRLGAKGVESLVITEENADTQETYDAIASAGVVFIRGGSQSRYVQWWKGTRTQAAIVEVWKKGGVVAGTSAGCAVLGEVVYDAIGGSLLAREAIANGRSDHLSLTTGFLNLVPGVLFDTHFTERGRLFRLPVMLASFKQDSHRDDVLGIGVDPRTAVCIGPDGVAEIRGEGTATMLRLTRDTQVVLAKGEPPTVTDLEYAQLCAGHRYDLGKQTIIARPEGMEVRVSALWPPVLGRADDDPPYVIHGEDKEGKLKRIGAFCINPRGADDWLAGPVALDECKGPIGFAVVATRALSDQGTPLNLSGVQCAIADHAGLIGVWVDEGATVHLQRSGRLTVRPVSVAPRSVVVLDAADPSILRGHGPPPRRAPVIERGKLHILGQGWKYDAFTGKVSAP